MSEIFHCQTLEAWTEQGWAGLLPVIWCGAKEFIAEGVCPRASSPAVVSGAASLLFTSVTFGCMLWTLENPLAVKALGDRLHQVVWESGRAGVSSSHRNPSRRKKVSTLAPTAAAPLTADSLDRRLR